MAEARCAVSQPRVEPNDEQARYPSKDAFRVWRRFLIKRFFRTRNLIYNGLWPTSIWNLGVFIFSLLTLLLVQGSRSSWPSTLLWQFADSVNIPTDLPYGLSELLVSVFFGLIFFIVQLYIRRYLLRALLSYRGWMYETPRSQGLCTKLWGLTVRLVSGYSPLLYSCQQSLPRLPVPPLNETLKKLIDSLLPLYGENSTEIINLKKQAQEFAISPGPKLQHLLVLKSWWALNWVTDWWEKYIYLRGRSPLPINSNYYSLDHSFWKPTTHQISRAAVTLHQFMVFKQKLDREEIKPLLIRNTIPICMYQYERIFATTRIPGHEIDFLMHNSSSKHIVVLRKGLIYKLNMFDIDSKLLSPANLEQQIQWIIEDADKHQDEYSNAEKSLAAFTCIERQTWADIRKQYFSEGINKESLDYIENAIVFVTLETVSVETLMERSQYLIQGNGKSIWFDKSFNLVYFANGRMGLNCEHSYADAPAIGHCQEFVMTNELINSLYTKQGFAIKDTNFQQSKMQMPQRLVWDFPESINPQIDMALSFAIKNKENIDLVVRMFDTYGKGFMKMIKVSPDAYIQSALQLTYYTYYKKLALTYESSMTRLYLLGRTETVRSLTSCLAEFVRAMKDERISKEKKISLLRKACGQHQTLYKNAMNGKGIDRHLFGLYVLSEALGYDCQFLKHTLTLPWTLSTSQQPQQQITTSPDCNLPEFDPMLGPGGGFGPVSDTGYGISYMIAGNKKIFFHISSRRSAQITDSTRFMDLLFETLCDMKSLFE